MVSGWVFSPKLETSSNLDLEAPLRLGQHWKGILIKWVEVGINALWVLGAAGVLASFSYTSWWVHERGIPLRQALGKPVFQFPFSLSMALTCLGLVFCTRSRLEGTLGLILTILFTLQAHKAWRGK